MPMCVDMSEVFFLRWLGAGSVVMSSNDTGEEILWTTTGTGEGTDSEREIDSDVVTISCGEK